MVKKSLIYFFIVGPLLAAVFLGVHISFILNWEYPGPSKEFTIKPGEGFASINYRLYKEGIIDNARIFHYYSKFQGKLEQLKTGVYLFEPGVTTPDVVRILSSGNSQLYSVTIPEGKNLYETADILFSQEVIKSKKEFIKEAKKSDYLKTKGVKAPTTEGYLFPDTYNFAPNSTPKLVIQTMIDHHFSKTQGLDFSKTKLSRHEAINLAAIVEKETGAKFERRTIAGVYYNRLKKRMRLQSDPTTIYGIWERFDGNLRKKDLFEKNAYNTYQIYGLPKGPISNPGLEAIKAVLDPEEHKYLYFVSKNNGTHVFSKTYKEHSKAVDHWQKKRANREGRSWRDLEQ